MRRGAMHCIVMRDDTCSVGCGNVWQAAGPSAMTPRPRSAKYENKKGANQASLGDSSVNYVVKYPTSSYVVEHLCDHCMEWLSGAVVAGVLDDCWLFGFSGLA